MENNTQNRDVTGYDYLEVKRNSTYMSMYLDGYKNLGWIKDDNYSRSKSVTRLKRDRKIMNKQELTRLQRHFEASMNELVAMEKIKYSSAAMTAIVSGVIGTVFLAGSVFAVTAEPPIIWLTALLGLPGLGGWILSMPIYKKLVNRDSQKVAPLIEAKYEEIYEIGEKANKLM